MRLNDILAKEYCLGKSPYLKRSMSFLKASLMNVLATAETSRLFPLPSSFTSAHVNDRPKYNNTAVLGGGLFDAGTLWQCSMTHFTGKQIGASLLSPRVLVRQHLGGHDGKGLGSLYASGTEVSLPYAYICDLLWEKVYTTWSKMSKLCKWYHVKARNVSNTMTQTPPS